MMMKVNTGNNQGALFVVQVDKEWRRSQRYPFHLRVTAVAHKTSLSFCRWCRLQVTNKHACTVRMWLCMKWRSMAHDCMLHTECADAAPVSCGTSHVTIKQRCPRPHPRIFKRRYKKATVSQLQGGGDSSVVRAPDSWLKGRGFESLLERRENFLLQGRLSVLTLISVSVPPPCYHSST